MSANTLAQYYLAVPAASLSTEVFPARRIKSTREIRAITQAQRATELAILAVRDELAQSTVRRGIAHHGNVALTAQYLKRVAARKLAEFNCTCPDMIISSGKQSALPHHTGSGPIREGAVVVDIFAQSSETRYFADCTRTFVVGDAPKTFASRYDALLAVHRVMKKAARHGATDIDKQSRDIIESHGFLTDYGRGTGYIHSLGHGVGLEIHEMPRLKERLVAGNVITIEPGLYYDYGIRVEDIGVVTKTGFRPITKLSKRPYL